MFNKNKQNNLSLLDMHSLDEFLNSDNWNKLGLLRIGQDVKKINPIFCS